MYKDSMLGKMQKHAGHVIHFEKIGKCVVCAFHILEILTSAKKQYTIPISGSCNLTPDGKYQ